MRHEHNCQQQQQTLLTGCLPPAACCRLSNAVLITLMLALVALEWVIAADLPDNSYLLPTSQLILLAYVSLGLLVMISVAIYRIR